MLVPDLLVFVLLHLGETASTRHSCTLRHHGIYRGKERKTDRTRSEEKMALIFANKLFGSGSLNSP